MDIDARASRDGLSEPRASRGPAESCRGDDTLHTVVAPSSAASGTVTTTHTRDALGNETSRTLAGGPVQTFTYNALGQLTATNGVMQYPVSYEPDRPAGDSTDRRRAACPEGGVPEGRELHQYDDRGGRLRKMTMGNQGDWREPRWITGGVCDPEGETSVRRERVNCSGWITTWNYSASGWLTSKKDHAAKGAVYTYTAGGKLKTRTWERGAHTRYEPSRLAGGKTDDGRVRCPKGEASGRRMRHHYDPAGRLVWRRYFTSAGSDTGSNAGNDPLTGDVNLVWDRLSRLEIATASGGGSRPAIVTTREYDPTLLTWMAAEQTSITGKIARTGRSDFDTLTGQVLGYAIRHSLSPAATLDRQVGYTWDTAGRLETVTGYNFDGANRTFTYAYEPNGGDMVDTVTGPVHTTDNTWDARRDVLKVRNNIAKSAFTYEVNNLGQRTKVTMTGQATGQFDWAYNGAGELQSATHTTTPAYNRSYAYDTAGNFNGTSGGVAFTPTALNQYSHVGGVAMVHDNDGNMTTTRYDAGTVTTGTVSYDGENRVIAFADRNFYYDAFARRTVKIHTAAAVAEFFFYDGWNPAAKYGGPVSGTPTLSRAYLWGLDVSGTFQGAGGVGGHLAVDFIGSGVYYPLCDGNGNITEYLNTSGAVVAHYRYDPFGRTLFSTGTLAGNFEFRFSSKRIDPETGCYYYGYRMYNPYIGRWLNKDPIGEWGGFNLYGFVGNDAVNYIDILGMIGGGNGMYLPGVTPGPPTPHYVNTRTDVGGGDRIRDFRQIGVELAQKVSDKYSPCYSESAPNSGTYTGQISGVQTDDLWEIGRMNVEGTFTFTRRLIGKVIGGEYDCCKVYEVNIEGKFRGLPDRFDFDDPFSPSRGAGIPFAMAGAVLQKLHLIEQPYFIRFTGEQKHFDRYTVLCCE